MAILGDTDLVVRWFQQVWNEGRESAIDELAAPDVLFHTLRGGFSGTAAFKEFHRALRSQIGDLQFTVVHALGVGEYQAVYCRARGVQRLTGQPVEFVGGGIGRIANGRLAEAWDAWTFLDAAEQMGLIPGQTFEKLLGMRA